VAKFWRGIEQSDFLALFKEKCHTPALFARFKLCFDISSLFSRVNYPAPFVRNSFNGKWPERSKRFAQGRESDN
jgi:hypothetical protein